MDVNPLPTPQEEAEAQMTALLLGELSQEQAAAMRQKIAQDPTLCELHARLERTLPLLREAARALPEMTGTQGARMGLSEERRQQLRAAFRNAPTRSATPMPEENSWFIQMSIAAALVVLIGSAAVLAQFIGGTRNAFREERKVTVLAETAGRAVQSGSDVNWFRRSGEADFGSVPAGVPNAIKQVEDLADGSSVTEENLATTLSDDPRSRAALTVGQEVVVAGKKPAVRSFWSESEVAFSPDGRAQVDQLATTPPPPASQPEPAMPLNKDYFAKESAREQEAKNGVVDQSKRELSEGVTATTGLSLGVSPQLGARFKRDSTWSDYDNDGVLLKRTAAPDELDIKSQLARGQEVAGDKVGVPAPAGSMPAQGPLLNRPDDQLWSWGAMAEPKQEHRILDRYAYIVVPSLMEELERLGEKPAPPAPVAEAEVQTSDNAFSTFSLNVTDVSFRLAAASLEKGQLPDAATIRAEEFINAFNYRDPEPPAGAAVGFTWEQARSPFAQGRDLLRLAVKTAARGRQPGRPLNLVLLLDRSGSMERADRVQVVKECLRALAEQLRPEDKLSVVTFARTARLWVDGVSGDHAKQALEQASDITPEGGTNLEEALGLAYATALRQYTSAGINRVVLITDGAANLGQIDPSALKQEVETRRKQGVALDCFGIGWEGYDDNLLQVLSSHGDGRYGFVNTPEQAVNDFASLLAGALQVAASDVKVQVEFNPRRVPVYRQIGYAKHQLTKEQFRDNSVDAAELGAAESGNALYVMQVNPAGDGPIATVRVRFRTPGTAEYSEQEWTVPYTGNSTELDASSPAMRLAAVSGTFAEWLAGNPQAAEVRPDRLLALLNGVPQTYAPDPRPGKLEWIIRQAQALKP